MRLRSRTWLLISVLCLIGAAVFWRLGEQLSRRGVRGTGPGAPAAPAAASNSSVTIQPLPGSSPLPVALRSQAAPSGGALASAVAEPNPLRLRNTTRDEEELARDDRALLLRNAVIDTSEGTSLPIPERLRAEGEAGSYIVQLSAPITPALRRRIEGMGAEFVAYYPVNAHLVRATAAQAESLETLAEVRAVIPNEPYFKIWNDELLRKAVADEPLDPEQLLKLTLLPGGRDRAAQRLAGLDASVVAEFGTPFGPGMVVSAPPTALAAMAQIPEVQGIEIHRQRQLMNDLARERMGISVGTNAPGSYTNYLGLTGTNVVVNINDSGVDATHPGLEGRVASLDSSALIDIDGHGTHVAGTIAGNGMGSELVTNVPPGSVANADFRGMAPEAELFVLPTDLLTGPLISDEYLQQAAATNYYVTRGKTNVLLSNNSWGYIGDLEYSIASASYDAAVRDALPMMPGAQPILYVFAGGNDGFGEDDGNGGEPSSIHAPATGKNVITVGAIEQRRNVTNEIVYLDEAGEWQTNQVFLGDTDTDYQVTAFSSRGNVEPGVEGRYGRFKPDVVAPGSFVASARSRDWIDPNSFSSAQVNRIGNQEVVPGGIQYYPLFVANGAGEFRIRLLPNANSPDPFPGLPIYLRRGSFPTRADLVSTNNQVRVPPDAPFEPGSWFYGVGNDLDRNVSFDIQTIVVFTNDLGNYFEVLKELNDTLAPEYRFESGTSMSTPAVTGLLALFQDYFQRQDLYVSPALLKALLINGARSAGSLYNWSIREVLNLQGWGYVNLTNTLPAERIGSPTGGVYSVQFADERGQSAIQTGERRTWDIEIAPEARNQILKATLVWTDPPGNPAAGVKLVNDLDLLIRDANGDVVYGGNDFPFRNDFTTPRPDEASITNDVVNNVENILIQPPLGTNYQVEVRGRRVNVNAVTDYPDGIAQDFALVVSLENTSMTNVLKVTPTQSTIGLDAPLLSSPTNGLALLTQRVGANPPSMGNTHGSTNQWAFFVFTNLQEHTPSWVGLTNGSNVAFITFLPPNLSVPRSRDADIDLYVSTDPQLTNLAPAAVESAFTSRGPGGTELVFFTNAPLGEVYYIGVKSEDQQAAEFGFVALSSDLPFDEEDDDGNRIVRGMPVNMAIPDGSPDEPKAAYIFGVATRSFEVQNVIVTNTLAFDSTGDILANLAHNDSYVVLNNHALDPTGLGGIYTVVYDDSSSGRVGSGNILAVPTDGPGRLTDFIGTDSTGPWILTVVDNALTQTATNVAMSLLLQPAPVGDEFISTTVEANSANFYSADVPSNATNMIFTLRGINPDVPLFVAIRRGDLPSFTVYDKAATIGAPGGEITLGRRDVPPLNPGRYYFGVFNPNPVPVEFEYLLELELDLTVSSDRTFGLRLPFPLEDDALSKSTIFVPDDREIVDVNVGIRVDHPRVSDLVFHIVSPQGTRLLLSENRGGPDGTAYGIGTGADKVFTTFPANTNRASVPIKDGIPPFTNNAVASGASNMVVLSESFENAIPRIYLTTDIIPNGWSVVEGTAEVIRSPVGSTNTVDGLQYLRLPDGFGSAIETNLVLTPGVSYRMRFQAGMLPVDQPQGLTVSVDGAVAHTVMRPPGPQAWHEESFTFTATVSDTLLEIRGPADTNAVAMAVDAIVIEEAERPSNAYYLPEEALKPLLGERALGNWTLEIRDTRAGPPGLGKGELDWRLEFVYALPSIDAVKLTNNVPYYGTVSGVDVDYFYVDVPRCATRADNTLAGEFATLLLYGDRDGLPAADLTAFLDDYGPYLNYEPGGLAQFTITTNLPAHAPLRPGQRYYLAVRNFPADLEGNPYGIRVVFDCEDPPLPDVTSLTNGVPVSGTVNPGPGFDYYQFVVSSNAIRAVFELEPVSGNVDMYIRKGVPGDFPLPSTSLWDYRAIDPDPTVTDVVSIDRTSDPQPLTPGVWYVAVRTTESAPADYTLVVNEFTAPIITLTNAVAHTNTIAAYDPAVGLTGADLQYYGFLVSSNSIRAEFETYDATGDVNLYVRRGLPIPTPADYDLASFNPGTDPEYIAVTNTSRPLWLTPGWWFLAVENADVTNVTYTIRATEHPALIIPLENDVAYTNSIAPGESLDYYSFDVSPAALSAKFEVFGMTDDVQLLVRESLPLPTFNNFTYASTNAGLVEEEIELTAFSFPVGLTAGNWYLSVANTGTNVAEYVIRASQEVAVVIPLTNGVPYNAAIEPGEGFDYYQFQVSSNAIAAQFLLTSGMTADLDMFLRKGPPLPNEFNAQYAATTPGVGDELIELQTNSVPVPLSPGIWYLAVTNRSAGPATYEITATEFGVSPPPPSGEITNIVVGTNSVCITWSSIPGTNYYVVAKTNVFDPAWTPVSPTITAEDTSTTWCLEPVGLWRFFDVFEGESPVTPIPGPDPVLTIHGTNICVSWTSAPGVTYYVQGRRSTSDPTWTTLTPVIVATGPTTEVCYPIEWGYRFFRVGLGSDAPPTPTPIPAEEIVVDMTLDSICITWPTRSGLDYLVEGKRRLSESNWAVISEPIRGDGTPQTLCLNSSTEFRYFRVLEGASLPPSRPPNVPVPNVRISVDAAFQLCLTWDALLGAEYFVEAKERFADPVWTVISPIMEATGLELSYCQSLGSPWRYFQVRRVNTPPDAPVMIEAISMTPDGPQIAWSGPAGTRYQVFYSTDLGGEWLPAGDPVTSLTGDFVFVDDGAATGGFTGVRFYRIERLP